MTPEKLANIDIKLAVLMYVAGIAVVLAIANFWLTIDILSRLPR